MNRIWQSQDRLVAILGLIVSGILALWLYLSVGYYFEIPAFLCIACAAYLLIVMANSSSKASRPSSVNGPVKSSTYLIFSTLFFVLFAYSIMAVDLRPELYSRPLGYFIAIAFMAALLGAQIFLLPSGKRSYTYFLLFEIIIFGVNLSFIPQLIFPGVVGIDPWAHQSFTSDLLALGHIPEAFPYSELPIMHLIVGSTSLLTGLDYPLASMLSISLIQVIIFVIFTFLIGRLLVNPKAGLLGALVLMMAPDLLSRGFYLIPGAFSTVWMLMIIYLLFIAKQRTPFILICLSFLFMGVLILTHTITALAMAILLFCLRIGFEIYKRAQRVSFEVPFSFYISSLFTVGMLGWWMYSSGHFSFLGDLIKSGFTLEAWGHSIIETGYIGQLAYSEFLLNMLGFLLFYTFAIIGSLHMISPACRNSYKFALVLGGFALLAIAALSLPLERTGFLTGRWFIYTQLIMAIPFAVGLISVSRLFRNRLASGGLLLTMTLIMSFLMTTNSTTNFDNPIYAKDLTTRNALTTSEQQGMNTITDIWEGEIEAEYPDIYYLVWNRDAYVESMAPCLLSEDYTDCQEALLVVREEMLENPIQSGEGILKLDYDLPTTLEEQGFSRIYDCGSVSAFLKR
jgi:hypothetical protein